jgi:hypothetical protein
VIEQQNRTMFYPTDMTEQQARDWAFNPDWKPCPVNETREEYDQRLSGKPPQMRDHHWKYYKWIEKMSFMTSEERFESWKSFQQYI